MYLLFSTFLSLKIFFLDNKHLFQFALPWQITITIIMKFVIYHIPISLFFRYCFTHCVQGGKGDEVKGNGESLVILRKSQPFLGPPKLHAGPLKLYNCMGKTCKFLQLINNSKKDSLAHRQLQSQ